MDHIAMFVAIFFALVDLARMIGALAGLHAEYVFLNPALKEPVEWVITNLMLWVVIFLYFSGLFIATVETFKWYKERKWRVVQPAEEHRD